MAANEKHDREQERQYTLSISEEDRQRSFELEDKRWARNKQIRDWLILIGLILIMWAWQLIVYFSEPGLR